MKNIPLGEFLPYSELFNALRKDPEVQRLVFMGISYRGLTELFMPPPTALARSRKSAIFLVLSFSRSRVRTFSRWPRHLRRES